MMEQASKGALDKFVKSSPTNKPNLSMSLNVTERNNDLNERLWKAWQKYGAKSEADTTLGAMDVKAYNRSDEFTFDSLTRLMQLRIPVPNAPFEKGTISICRLTYLKEEEKEARKKLGKESWFKAQKQAALNWKNHILAKPNLPPDRFVEHDYYKNFDHIYPKGIDAKRNDKREADLEAVRLLTGGAEDLKNKNYAGNTEAVKKQRAIDKEMQRLIAEGVSDRERIIFLRNMGGGTENYHTAGTIHEHLNRKVKMTSHERKEIYHKANLGKPDLKPNNKYAETVKADLAYKTYEKHDYNSYTNPREQLQPYQIFTKVEKSNKEALERK